MKNNLSFLVYSVIILLLYILFGVIFWGSHKYMLPCTMITTYVVSYIFLKRNIGNNLKAFLIIFPIELLFIIASLPEFNFSYSILYILFIPLSVYFSILYFKYKKLIIFFLFIGFSFFSGFFLFLNVFYLVNSKRDTANNQKFPNISLHYRNNTKVSLNNNIIVFDFWYSKCSVCYEKFPELEDLYLHYKGNSKVSIFSVNVPLKGERITSINKIVDSLNYTFPVIYSKSMKEINDSLKFNTFPHMIIIKNGKIRFNSFPETNRSVITNNVYDKIDNLIKEN